MANSRKVQITLTHDEMLSVKVALQTYLRLTEQLRSLVGFPSEPHPDSCTGQVETVVAALRAASHGTAHRAIKLCA
jgi:hypothetical protein